MHIGKKLTQSDIAFVKEVSLVIQDHISQTDLNAYLISQSIGMSRTGLYNKLKLITGMSVNEFIRSYRMQKSISMFVLEKMPIADVAFSLGFNSVSYFHVSFKNYYGDSPLVFLKKYFNNN